MVVVVGGSAAAVLHRHPGAAGCLAPLLPDQVLDAELAGAALQVLRDRVALRGRGHDVDRGPLPWSPGSPARTPPMLSSSGNSSRTALSTATALGARPFSTASPRRANETEPRRLLLSPWLRGGLCLRSGGRHHGRLGLRLGLGLLRGREPDDAERGLALGRGSGVGAATATAGISDEAGGRPIPQPRGGPGQPPRRWPSCRGRDP